MVEMREMSVENSEKTLERLNISKRAKNFLMRKYSTPDAVIWHGRYFAYKFNEHPAEREKALKSIIELVDALEEVGYIRHDISSESFGVGQLLKACGLQIIPSCIEDFCLTVDENGNMVVDYRIGNQNYETFSEPSDEQVEKMKSVLIVLTHRESLVLSYRYGLEDRKRHTLKEIGERFYMTRERIRQIEDKGLRKLRHRIVPEEIKEIFCVPLS